MKFKPFVILGIGILALALVIFVVPIKWAIDIGDENAVCDRFEQDIIVLCEFAQVTGGDWHVIQVIKNRNDVNIPDYINISGNVPNAKINRSSGSPIFGQTRFLFTGSEIKGSDVIYGESISELQVENWEFIYPYDHEALISYISKRKYLNLMEWLSLK